MTGPAGTAMIFRLANFDMLPFVVGQCERAGMAWSIDRHQGLAATVTMRHEGDPGKVAAAETTIRALQASARAMNGLGPDGEPA